VALKTHGSGVALGVGARPAPMAADPGERV